MRVAIVGSRTACDLTLDDIICNIPKECNEVISGGSGVVDLLAEQVAKAKNYKFRCFLPEYSKYGKGAPLVRNIKIIEYSDIVLAFWDQISRGTMFVIKEALKREMLVKTIYVNSKDSIFDKKSIK